MNSSITIENRDEILKILNNVYTSFDGDLTIAIQRCGRKFIEDLFMLSQLDNVEVSCAASALLQSIVDGLLLETHIPALPCNHHYGGYGYGGYGYGGYGYGGYGYGGYGYGGYGYGGYGYGGYGYGGYGYGGYGYGGYGYGGYGYGGYGYGGYGYGGYGYGEQQSTYKFIPNDSRKSPAENQELWNNDDFIWLNQNFANGVRNAEGLVWSFKDSNTRFTPEEGREILKFAVATSGDHDEGLFRAVAHAAIHNPMIFNKIKPN